MGPWRQYLFSVIVCSLLCAVVSRMLPAGKGKEAMGLAWGMVLAITLLKPLSGIRWEGMMQLPQGEWSPAETYITQGENTAQAVREECIKAACEAYILDKAGKLGGEVRVSVSLDGESMPAYVQIQMDPDEAIKQQLENILMTDLGIPKEHQKWVWNQESN